MYFAIYKSALVWCSDTSDCVSQLHPLCVSWILSVVCVTINFDFPLHAKPLSSVMANTVWVCHSTMQKHSKLCPLKCLHLNHDRSKQLKLWMPHSRFMFMLFVWLKCHVITLLYSTSSFHTGTALDATDRAAIIHGVIQEADIAKTEQLTYTEFEHVISRAPDFVNLFHITI